MANGRPKWRYLFCSPTPRRKNHHERIYGLQISGQIKHEISPKGVIMATYILCGFANFASIGIQIGGIGALIPKRRGELAKLGFQALIAGTLACLMTAVIVGMFY